MPLTQDDLTGRLILEPYLLHRHSWSALWKGRLANQPNCLIAIKAPRLAENSDSETMRHSRRHILQDFAALKLANHSCVQRLYGTALLNEECCLVMPFAQEGDLRAYLNAHPDRDPQFLLRQVASGVKYLHSRTSEKRWIIVHGDLHITNILVIDDSTAVVSDFGLCTIIYPEDAVVAHGETNHCAGNEMGAPEGHYASMAPEVATGNGPRRVESDVYSFGMLMFEAYTLSRPFPESRPLSALVRLASGRRPSRPETKNGCTALHDALWELITGCWAQEPSARPTMAEVHARL